MSIVAGVDFGTLSVRVSIFDSIRGRLGAGMAEYSLLRKKEDPDHATQSHADHMRALDVAMRQSIESAQIDGHRIEAIALDTTGSSVIPVDGRLEPIDDYYLWCDHRAWKEAGEITAAAREQGLRAIDWCGGVYSSEWGFAKLLHWLRNNPQKRDRFGTALEHCDMVAATLCGISDPSMAPRSICAMGHKWMWNAVLGGLPAEEFLASVDPLLAGVRAKLDGCYATSDRIAGHLAPGWAEKLGLRAGIPIPVGGIDAHWDAIGAGVRLGDVVNVVGTSTCIMAISEQPELIPGVCGVVQGSIHPKYAGIEAGLAATGDIFDAIARRAIARRANTTAAELSRDLEKYRAGETGLLRIAWDKGDRTVLANPELSGVTLGWRLTHTPQDELFAAIEGTALHTRVILERMEDHGVAVRRIINAGGIPKRNGVLNQVYANIMGKPILVPKGDVTSLGSAIFALLAAGTFPTIEAAQESLCSGYHVVQPEESSVATYRQMYPLFRKLYFSLGARGSKSTELSDILPELRSIAIRARDGHSG
jgi:L-ribulokinase